MSERQATQFKAIAEKYLREEAFGNATQAYRSAVLLEPRLLPDVIVQFEEALSRQSIHYLEGTLALFQLYISLGEMEKAILELEEVVALVPWRTDLALVLARLYTQEGQSEKALPILRHGLKYAPRDEALLEMLATLLLEKGDRAAAAAYLGQLRPSRQQLRLLAEVYAEEGKVDQAVEQWIALFQKDPSASEEATYKLHGLKSRYPENWAAQKSLAYVYRTTLRGDQAVQQYEHMRHAFPNATLEIEKELRHLLKDMPDLPSAHMTLGKLLLQKGAYSEAVVSFQKGGEAGEDYREQAIQGYEAVLAAYPSQVLATRSLGEAYLKKGNRDLALPLLAQAALQEGNREEAVQLAGEILTTHPDDIRGLEILGDAWMMAGDPQKASECFWQAVHQHPAPITLYSKYEEAKKKMVLENILKLKQKLENEQWRIATHLEIGKAYYSIGHPADAVEHLQLAAADHARGAFALYHLGLMSIETGQFESACHYLEKTLPILPKGLPQFSKEARAALGFAYEAMGWPEKALSVYEAILEEEITYANLQQVVRELKKAKLAHLRPKALQGVLLNHTHLQATGTFAHDQRPIKTRGREEILNLSFGQSQNDQAVTLFLKGLLPAALEGFSVATTLDENFPSAHNNVGVTLLAMHQAQEALAELQPLIERHPDHALYWNNVGLAHLLLKETDSAIQSFTRVIELQPERELGWLHLGDAFYQKGNMPEALNAWKHIHPHSFYALFLKRRVPALFS